MTPSTKAALKRIPGVPAALAFRRYLRSRRSTPSRTGPLGWSEFSPSRATFKADKLDQLAVSESLHRYGCALIKGLFDTKTLAVFDRRIEHNLAGIETILRKAGAPEGFNAGFPLYFGGKDSRERIHARLKNSYPAMFDPALMEGMDCTSIPDYVFRVLEKTGLDNVITHSLGLDRLFTSAALCHIRKFDFPASGVDLREAEKALEFHQDSKLYDNQPEILTLWFPFRYEHGKMTSLEFLPISERRLLPTVTRCGIDRDSVPQGKFWSPAYELGDAVLISGYCPHRTYYPRTASERKSRTSIDVRFFGADGIPAPIYPSPARDFFSRLFNRF